ncbi:choice-of-anchor G family protein [Microbacterium tumbae]
MNSKGRTLRRRRAIAGGLGGLTAAAVVIGGIVGPLAAQAAITDDSEAEGRLITGSAGPLDLNALAELGGAYSADPSSPGEVNHPVDVGVLNALDIDLGDGLQLFGENGILALGALGQYANTAEGEPPLASAGLVLADGSIAPASGDPTENAYLDLGPILEAAGLDALLDDARLELGAISALATYDEDGEPVGDYQIANGTLLLTSPTIAGLSTSLVGVLDQVSDPINDLVGEGGVIESTIDPLLDGLADTLNTVLLGVGSIDDLGVTATVDVDLEAAVESLLAEPLTSEDSVLTIDLSTGTVSVDLARLVADTQGGDYDGTLNGLPANTELLDPDLVQAALDGAIGSTLDQIPALLVEAVTDALNAADVNIAITGEINLLFAQVGAVNVELSGTLGGFIGVPGSTPPTTSTDGTTIIGLPVGDLLSPILTFVTNTALPALVTPLAEAITDEGTLDTLFRPIVETANALLQPLFGLVTNNLLSLTANVQETPGDFVDADGYDEGSFTERALQLTLLPALGTPLLEISLASATVRAVAEEAADVAITSPADGDEFTVPGEDDTASVDVSGTGEPGATVTVSIPGLEDQETVVEEDGTWTVTFPDVPVGDHTITASQTGGSTDTVDVSVVVDDEGDAEVNTNAAASASASATADDDSNASAQVAAQAAALADASTTASAAADASAEAAAEVAATADASTAATSDATTDATSSAAVAAQAAALADASDDTAAEASSAADATPASSAQAAAVATSSADASTAAAADADADADAEVNTNASASASASATADPDNNVAAQAAAVAAALADATSSASAAADPDAEAAAESAATPDASAAVSADATTDANASAAVAAQAAAQADNSSTTQADATSAADANPAASASVAAIATSSQDASATAAADAEVNTNASASASASATADPDNNVAAQAAAVAAALADATSSASAAADPDAEAAAESAATPDASAAVSADATTDANASAAVAAQAAAQADASDDTNASASAAADANPAASSQAAAVATSSADASAAAAADADADADAEVNTNASASASASATADPDNNVAAQAAAIAAALADASSTASAAADPDAEAAAAVAATADASTTASTDATTDANASAAVAAQAAAQADNSSDTNATASAAADANPNASAAAAATATSSATASATAAADADAEAAADPSAEATASTSADADADADGELGITVKHPTLERGESQTAIGTGFEPGEVVTGVMHSTPLALGTQVADDEGTVTFTWTIPAGTELGAHQVILTGATSGAVSGPFQVVAAGLAGTGSDAPMGWIALGVLLLVLGVGTALVARSRRVTAAAE